MLALGSTCQVYDASTTTAVTGGRYSRDPFPNNIIPTSGLAPVALTPLLSFASIYTRGPFNTSSAPTIGGEIAAFLLGVPGGRMDRGANYAQQYLRYDHQPGCDSNLGVGAETGILISRESDNQ